MTDEDTARARLLAYYDDRIAILAAKLAQFQERQLDTTLSFVRARQLASTVARMQADLIDTIEKARRLRDSISQT